jgi:enoyl-CoA hydratase/carnithine racemase
MIVDPENLMLFAEKIADQIASKSSIQTQFIKELVNKGIEVDLHTGNSLEILFFSTSFSTHDQKEGMKAFLEKRKPDFKGK